jgi:hypothetical protein
MRIILSSLSLAVAVAAQLPTPNPIPRTAPRAHWVQTAGVTGTPTQRRDNPGAASNDRMYVFGGRDANAGTAVRNALYEFNGMAWTLKTAEGAPGSPPARGGACVAWDRARNKLMVFGGDTGGSPTTLLGDTWEWDPATNAWTNVTPAGASPSPRRFAAMDFDPITGGMLLFGGETAITTPASTPSNETWLLSGGVWNQLGSATVPPARRMHSLATRPDFGDVLMCCGADPSTTPEVRMLDVWKWTSAGWVLIPTTTIPHGTTASQAIYDPIRKRLVVQGGQGISVPNTAGGGGYGDLYGGSPSTWCSEFDSLTNEWTLYGAPGFNTADPVIGRISRYFGAFIPALGKIYKVSGQNPSGTGTITATCEYQAVPVATTATYGAGCTGGGGVVTLAADNAPWTTRTFSSTATNLVNGSLAFAVVGFTTASTPLSSLVPFAGAGCDLLAQLDVTAPLVNVNGSATLPLPVPDNTALTGRSLHLQVLQIEIAAVKLTSSNGLTMTFGAL